jgi:putative Holliday junction resolvase
MGRVMGIDYGTKKTGLAVTDPLQIIVNPLDTVDTKLLFSYLKDYFSREEVEKVVVGEPFMADGITPAQHHPVVMEFIRKFRLEYPDCEVDLCDETYSSRRAREIVNQTVPSRKKRRNKLLVDKIAATLILQQYLNHI